MMSGGDFDGDKAWVCWEESLVNQVSIIQPVDTTQAQFTIEKSQSEQKLASVANLRDRLRYARHFRGHHNNLCDLSTTLDLTNDFYGIESPESTMLSTQAFLQVDHPYKLCEIPQSYKTKFNLFTGELQHPHWKKNKNALLKRYKSKRALGILWDYMEDKIQSIHKSNEEKNTNEKSLNPHILSLIEIMERKCLHDELRELREKMKAAVLAYNRKVYEYLSDTRGKCEAENRTEINAWLKREHMQWRRKLIDTLESEDEKMRSAAVLYEQTRILSNKDSTYNKTEKGYQFAWSVAHDYLTRIIGDGDQRVRGLSGVSATVNRENEGVIYKRKRA